MSLWMCISAKPFNLDSAIVDLKQSLIRFIAEKFRSAAAVDTGKVANIFNKT